MKKTLRLLLTLDCNLSCQYCCNKISEVNSRFIKKGRTSMTKLEELKKIYEICPDAMECIAYDKLKKEIEKIRFQDLKNMGFDVDRFMK